MSKGFWFAVVAIAAFTMGSLVTHQVITDRLEQQQAEMDVTLQEQEAFDFVCQALKVDCSQVPFPHFSYVELTDEFGTYENGTANIEIAQEIKGTNAGKGIMVHEILHYFQWIARNDKFETKIQQCANEKASHQLALLYAKYEGFSDPNLFTWDEVKATYHCLN